MLMFNNYNDSVSDNMSFILQVFFYAFLTKSIFRKSHICYENAKDWP